MDDWLYRGANIYALTIAFAEEIQRVSENDTFHVSQTKHE